MHVVLGVTCLICGALLAVVAMFCCGKPMTPAEPEEEIRTIDPSDWGNSPVRPDVLSSPWGSLLVAQPPPASSQTPDASTAGNSKITQDSDRRNRTDSSLRLKF